MTTLEKICEVCKLPYPKEGSPNQDFLERIVRAVDGLSPEVWDTLPDTVQEWCNTTITAFMSKRRIPLPDDFDEDYRPAKPLTVPERVPSEPEQVSLSPSAVKSDGSTSAGRRKGKGAGKKAARCMPPRARIRKRKRGNGYEVIRYAIEHQIKDIEELRERLKDDEVLVADGTAQAGLYGLRHVTRALADIETVVPPMLEIFLTDEPKASRGRL